MREMPRPCDPGRFLSPWGEEARVFLNRTVAAAPDWPEAATVEGDVFLIEAASMDGFGAEALGILKDRIERWLAKNHPPGGPPRG